MNTKVGQYTILFLGIVILLNACTDILETDISGQEVKILSPLDRATVTTPQSIFWWEPLDGATQYELQVVSPSFKSIINLHADTVLKQNIFTMELPQGVYQWRIRAQNSAYQTKFIELSFDRK